MIWCREAMDGDAEMIARHLRAEDRREVMRTGDGDVLLTLQRTIAQADMAGVFFDGAAPLALFGVAPGSVTAGRAGIPFMVGTDSLTRCPKAMLRETRRWVAEWRQQYDVLTNWVDADYTGAIRWLRWLGFTIGKPEPVGLHGALFSRIEMKGSR